MGRYVFRLPDVGEGIAEVEVVAWHVAPGTIVAEDDALVEVMTDKATVEIPSPRTGRVVTVNGEPGEKIRVGSDLVVLEVEGGRGEAAEGPLPLPPPAGGGRTVSQAVPPLAGGGTVSEIPPPLAGGGRGREPVATSQPPRPTPGKPLASPAVRQHAYERGIPLQAVAGTGPGGRVLHVDLDAYQPGAARAAPHREAIEEVKIIGLRRRIAERMQELKRRIPHYAYVEELDVTTVEELRAQLNARHGAARGRLTLLPFLVAALVRAVPDFPQVNVLFDDEAGILRRHAALHVGIATQTPNGLLVPVLRHAESLGLWESAAEIARLAAAARDGKATREELTGSTITITSLGALGGIAATPVINIPEVAIIGVNRIVERPVVRDGHIVVRKMMNLSSSFDHRVVDGFDAASFVQALKGLLETPAMLFID